MLSASSRDDKGNLLLLLPAAERLSLRPYKPAPPTRQREIFLPELHPPPSSSSLLLPSSSSRRSTMAGTKRKREDEGDTTRLPPGKKFRRDPPL
ncbi:hypothetical protein PCASD_12266, partial [Puccinia coronata f. sp. avenae]